MRRMEYKESAAAVLGVTIFILFMGIITEGIVFYAAAALLFLLIAADYYRFYLSRRWLRKTLDVQRDVNPAEIYLGSSARLTCRLAYRGRARMAVRVTQPLADDLHGDGRWPPVRLHPGAGIALETLLKPSSGGTFAIDPPEVEMESWFFKDSFTVGNGLSLAVHLPIGSPASGEGWPNLRARNHVNIFEATTARKGKGIDFLSLRQYVAGDSLKRIDWARSSLANALMVREYEDMQPMPIFFIIDLDASMGLGEPESGLSSAVKLATTVINNTLRNEERVGIAGFSRSGVVEYVHAGMGLDHLYKVRKLLSGLRPATDGNGVSRHDQETLPYDLKGLLGKEQGLDALLEETLKGYMANVKDDGFSMAIKASLKSLNTSSLIIIITNLSMGMTSLLNGTRIARYYGHKVAVVLLPHVWHEEKGLVLAEVKRSVATMRSHDVDVVVLYPGQKVEDIIRDNGMAASRAIKRG